MLERLLEIVKSKPENLEERKELRKRERKQITEQKLKSFGFKWSGVKTKGRDISEILADCENILIHNPYDISTLLTLGKAAALEESYWETAIHTLYDAAALVNRHVDEYKEANDWRYEAHKELGNVFVKKEEYETALKNYKIAESCAGDDKKRIEIDRLIKDAEAKEYTKKMKDEGGKESQARRTEEGQRIKQEREEELREAAEKPKEKTPLDEAIELYEAEDYINAVSKLQKLAEEANKEIKAKSNLYLGMCYEALEHHRLIELAEKRYEQALETAEKGSELWKEILYTRGTMYAQAGIEISAENDFLRIFNVDINYKDVKEKVLGKES